MTPIWVSEILSESNSRAKDTFNNTKRYSITNKSRMSIYVLITWSIILLLWRHGKEEILDRISPVYFKQAIETIHRFLSAPEQWPVDTYL